MHGDAGLLEVLPQLYQAEDRPTDPAGQHGEGNQLADAERALDDQPCAEPQQQGVGDLVDQAGSLAGDVAQVVGTKGGPHVTGELFFPLATHLWLHSHGLERFHAVDGFHQKGLILCTTIELFIEARAQYWRNDDGQQNIER